MTYQMLPEKSAWLYANVSDTKNLVGDELVASAIKSAMAELGPNEVTNRTKIEPLAQQKLAESLNQKYGEGAVFINTKKIEIDGQQVDFRASAAVPRLYRIKFGRDIYRDLRQLESSVGDNSEDASNLDMFSLEMFEDLAWIMAKHAHPDQVPDTPDEWLENFNTFSIYQILPQLIELWGLNVQTEVEARKNLAKVSG